MKSSLKIFSRVLMVLAILALCIGITLYMLTRPLVNIADNLFDHLKHDKEKEVYALFSSEFVKNTNLQELSIFFDSRDLKHIRKSHWMNRSIGLNGVGYLKGYVQTAEESSVPLEIEFVREQGQWKIYAIYHQFAGLIPQCSALFYPSEKEQEKLIKQATEQFFKAYAQNKWLDFYDYVAKTWQRTTSPEKLGKTFVSNKFTEALNKLSPKLDEVASTLSQAEPYLFNPPLQDKKGILYLNAGYRLDQGLILLELRYLYESYEWKLIGLNANIRALDKKA